MRLAREETLPARVPGEKSRSPLRTNSGVGRSGLRGRPRDGNPTRRLRQGAGPPDGPGGLGGSLSAALVARLALVAAEAAAVLAALVAGLAFVTLLARRYVGSGRPGRAEQQPGCHGDGGEAATRRSAHDSSWRVGSASLQFIGV